MSNLPNRTLTSSGWSSRLALAASTAMTVLVVLLPIHLAGCGADGKGALAGNPPVTALAPPLGAAQTFAVLGGSTVTNTGSSVITGDLGVSPGSAVTGFPPGLVSGGTIHAADAVALQAQNDTITVSNSLAGQACTSDLTGQDLGGLTLVPGVYCFSTSAQLTGVLTLNAGGVASAVWVFKTGSTLTTAPGSSVLLTNGGRPCNVFWQVGSSATLGTTTSFIGHVIALTSITLNTGASVSGSVLARNGAVTLDSNTVALPVCGVVPVTIPPTLGKAFSPATIDAGGVSILTITLSNADSAAASLTAAFVDTLPSGVVIAATPDAGTTCGGAVTATAGGSTVTLTGGSIPASGSCTVTVAVTAPGGGVFVNTLPAGALQTSNGNNAAPAAATLTVNAPGVVAPTLGKAFSPATIDAGGVSILTITLSNAASAAASLTAAFVDTLPSGVVIAATPDAGTTCGGAVTATAGGSTVTLTGGSIPASGSCTVTVAVTAPAGGAYVNTLPAGALQTSNGNNAAPAAATLTVNAPGVVAPTLGKAFSPATIDAGGVSTVTITLHNPNDTAATLTAAFVDTLPSGVVIAATPDAGTTCGGAVTATAGGSTVTLTGGSIPASGSCTVTVAVTAPGGGVFVNTLPAGALQTSNGNNAAPAAATLTVNTPGVVIAPTLGKAFSPATIDAGGVSTVTITLHNPNDTVATLTAPLVDTLPSGLVVAGSGPNASNTCGGTFTPATGDSTVTMTGGSIPANGSCTVKFDVYAPSGGVFVNTLPAGALQTSNGNNAAPAAATLTVNTHGIVIAPTLGKTFSPATIDAGGVSTVTITLHNPNDTVATLTAPLVDTLPSGLVVAGSGPNASNTCGGTFTPVTGDTTVTMTGGSIPANGSCTVKFDVYAPSGGVYVNTVPAGALQTSNGNSAAPAAATLTVSTHGIVIAPTLGKAVSPATINAGEVTTVTITLHNPNDTIATLTAPLVDTLPSGLEVAGSGPNASNTCGGTFKPITGDTEVIMTGGSIPANGSCTVKFDMYAPINGIYVNTLPAGALETSNGSNAAAAAARLIVL